MNTSKDNDGQATEMVVIPLLDWIVGQAARAPG